MLENFQWVVFIIAAFYGLACSIGHWLFIIEAIYRVTFGVFNDRNYSFGLPFVGSWLLVLAAFIYPLSDLSQYWWLAFIIEPQYIIFAVFGITQKIRNGQGDS